MEQQGMGQTKMHRVPQAQYKGVGWMGTEEGRYTREEVIWDKSSPDQKVHWEDISKGYQGSLEGYLKGEGQSGEKHSWKGTPGGGTWRVEN